MKAWHVYLDRKVIDTVFCTEITDADSLRRSLINHDGYDHRITVKASP